MILKEYAKGLLGRFGVSDDEIDFMLQDNNLNPSDVLTSENKVSVKTAIYHGVPVIVAGLADVTEGGYSIKYNIRGIREWFSILAKELGLEDTLNGQPKVRDKSYLW